VRNPFSRPSDLHGLFEDFCFHRFLAQHPLQFTDLLEHIAQLRGRHHGFTGADRRQAAVLIQLRQRNNWLALMPLRRATTDTLYPGSRLSRTMASFCSGLQRRRRSWPNSSNLLIMGAKGRQQTSI
jgi:hypothetical protein